jgi:hypothetical protein
MNKWKHCEIVSGTSQQMLAIIIKIETSHKSHSTLSNDCLMWRAELLPITDVDILIPNTSECNYLQMGGP